MNKRGDFTFILGEKEVKLRPTLEALADIEDDVGESVTDILGNAAVKRPGVRLVLATILHGHKATFPDGMKHTAPGREEISGWVQSAGFGSCVGQVLTFLTQAVVSDEQLEAIKRGKDREPETDG